MAAYTNLKAGISSDAYEPTTRLDDGDLDFGGVPDGGANDDDAFLGVGVDDVVGADGGVGKLESLEPMEVAVGEDDDGHGAGRTCWPSALSVRAYRPLFDVDQSDVQRRLLWPLSVSHGYDSFLSSELRGEDPKRRADLYGPVWIATTLVLQLAIVANARSWLLHVNEGASSGAWTVGCLFLLSFFFSFLFFSFFFSFFLSFFLSF